MLRQKSKKLKGSIDNHIVANFIKDCQSLVGITKNDFIVLYESVITHCIQFLRKPNEKLDSTVIAAVLQPTLIALKKRRGYFLPLGADSEVVFRERELWTYAVFTASLINRLATNAKGDLAKALLPITGYDWLYRHHRLFEQWSHFLNGDMTGNIFADIIGTSHTITTMDATVKPTRKPVSNITKTNETPKNRTTESTLSASEQIKAALPDNTVIQEITVNERETLQTTAQPGNNNPVEKPAMEQSLPDFSSNDFFNWLHLAIKDQKLSINEETSLVYRAHEGFLLLLPELIDRFLQAQAKILQLPTTAIKTRDKTQLTKHIKKHPSLVISDIGERFYTYCLGQWQERNTRFGIVVTIDQFMDLNQTFPIHSALALDPVDNPNQPSNDDIQEE